jgi:parvulin-like peptidyl-prolyl isomerase
VSAARAYAALLAGLAGGGGGGEPAVPRDTGPARAATGTVVATVDGVPITADEVRAVMRDRELRAEAALRALEDEALLFAEAERRGHAARPEVRQGVEQALAQALLVREVEALVPVESVSDADVAARFTADYGELSPPERRGSSHVLVPLEADASEARAAAAERIAGEILAELAAAPDPAAAVERYVDAERGAFALTAEAVPPLAAGDAAERAYLDAMFAAPDRGLVPAPVRSGYGWHEIVVTRIHPARELQLAEIEGPLRERMAAERRLPRLEALLDELGQATSVDLDEARVAALLLADPLAGAAP